MSDTENHFADKIKEESAKTLFELVWSIAKSLGKKTIDEIKVKHALNRYLENYEKRHGSIKILGMSEPIPLLSIYTDVKTISPSYLNKEAAIEELETNFKKNRGDYGYFKRESGIEVANEKQKLNVLGAPGSGKSTFLKRIGIEALVKDENDFTTNWTINYKHNCIPVLIELKRFKNEVIDLKKLIQNEFEIAGFPESLSFLEKSLLAGKLLILLDGLDEVPNNKLEETINHLKDFTDTYSNNRFITSCRTAFYKTYLKDFVDVEIASFDNDQVCRFIDNWFNLEKDKLSNPKNRLIQMLFEKNNEATLELARTPLLLTFICLTFDDSLKFPANRSSLYRRALMILMEKWAAEKRIHNEDIYQDLNSDIELEMLSDTAANLYIDDKIFFYRHEIKEYMTHFLENSLNAKNIPFSKILEAIEIQQGVIVQRAPDIYSFSHLTIQEYLTANFFYSPKKMPLIVEKFLFENRWREVFLLLAGISSADDLLLLMIEKLQAYANEEKLVSKIISWVNQLIPITEEYEKDACKRIFLASLLLRYKRYDEGYGRVIVRLEDYTSNLLNAIDKSFNKSLQLKPNISKKEAVQLLDLIAIWQSSQTDYSYSKELILSTVQDLPLNKMLNGSRHLFRKTLLQPFYTALNAPIGLYNLPKKEYGSFIKYIEGFSLVIECKNASLRVSKDTWKTICSSLLSNSQNA